MVADKTPEGRPLNSPNDVVLQPPAADAFTAIPCALPFRDLPLPLRDLPLPLLDLPLPFIALPLPFRDLPLPLRGLPLLALPLQSAPLNLRVHHRLLSSLPPSLSTA